MKRNKNRPKLLITKSKPLAQSIQTIGIKHEDDLPAYVRFVDGQDKQGKPFRMFFEPPKNKEETTNIGDLEGFKFVGKGKYNRGGEAQKKFSYMLTDGKKLVSEELAKSFCCLIIKKIKDTNVSSKNISQTNRELFRFLKYLSTILQEQRPNNFSSITQMHFRDWFDKYTPNKISHIRDVINSTLKLSKHYPEWKFSQIRASTSRTLKTNDGDAPIQVESIDELMKGTDYSDSELMQILAYCFYQIQISMEYFDKTMSMTKEKLGDTFIPLEDLVPSNEKIMSYVLDENEGHEIINNNLYFYFRNAIKGVKKYKARKIDSTYFISQIDNVGRSKAFILNRPECTSFKQYVFKNIINKDYPLTKKTSQYSGNIRLDLAYLTGTSIHPEFAIATYAMIITGVNLEVLKTWKWSIDGKPWHQNFDIQLGLDKDTAKKDAQIVLVGQKWRGQKSKVKSVSVPVKVNSPLYKYLIYLDKIRPQPREFIFDIDEYSSFALGFCKEYEIYDDENKRIERLQSRKFRKVFAGHKLIQLLDDVKSGDELVLKLRNALHHNNFDTTFFSYLLKSGAAHLVLNTAIVVLTSEFLEKALDFKGTIKSKSNERIPSNEVYLCDCSDPLKPSHGLPIAGRCTKYDMCLGCERSEVYPEHLPRIFYRIFQYEEQRSKNFSEFRAMSEDRLVIATKTIERFRNEHHQGEDIVNEAYIAAGQALDDGIQLLPPILQFR
jgi:hypothetical protein